MSNKHLNITYAYHFLSEAMIILLIATPILYTHYHWVPYWSYLIIIALLSLVFSLLSSRASNNAVFFVMALPLITVFYLIDYPNIINFAFTCLLIWRYLNIRTRSIVDLNRENGYIILTIALTMLGVVVTKSSELVIYASMQVLVLFFGNMMSHFVVAGRKHRKQFNYRSVFFILAPMIIGTVVLIPIFQLGEFISLKIWDGFRYVIYLVASGVGHILQFLDPTFVNDVDNEEVMTPSGGEEFKKIETESIVEVIAPYVMIVVSLIIICLIIFFAINLYKRMKKPLRQIEPKPFITYSYIQDSGMTQTDIFKSFKKRFAKPRHPIRRTVFEFEKRATRVGKGRKPFETIEEWLKRIGLSNDLEIYQKVRYGEKEVTYKEVNQLKNRLKQLEATF